MTQGIGTGESPEVRRALERLQSTLDILSDRYRDLRRERRQLRERIEQLEREREASSLSLSTRLEAAANDRKRAIEFEERALGAEKAQAELQNRIAELERSLAERDSLIADQADTIERQRERLDDNRRREEESWTQEERFREEIQTLRQQIARTEAESERYREQVRELEEQRNGQLTFVGQSAEELAAQLAELRDQAMELEMERASLQEAQAQLTARLDAAMRDAAIARNRSGELESEVDSLRTQLSHAGAAHEGDVAEATRTEAELARLREVIDAREIELRSLHGTIEKTQAESRKRAVELEETIAELQVDRERAAKALASAESDRDSARGTVESLLVRLKQLEASDDERLKAQRARIDELTHDLSEALDMAARKETETMLAQTEVERLQRQIVELTERRDLLTAELEKLHVDGTNGAVGSSTGISESDRRVLVDQLRDAITLIDKHLGAE